MPSSELVTSLLRQWSNGDKQALDQLMPMVYDQLRKIARNSMRSERPDHTLRATALVHEAYMKLVQSEVPWESRVHFYAVAAQVLRHILIDHAKAHRREKRGAGAQKISLEDAILVGPETSDSVLEIDTALKKLADKDPRKAKIVELLFFGGMTYGETATALDISPATVDRELRLAKAWLHRELTQPGSGDST
jgi:RNA polymerase sigma factor (TIGR02999 family)